jgi:hypothetical protein
MCSENLDSPGIAFTAGLSTQMVRLDYFSALPSSLAQREFEIYEQVIQKDDPLTRDFATKYFVAQLSTNEPTISNGSHMQRENHRDAGQLHAILRNMFNPSAWDLDCDNTLNTH